ncbi:MAG: sigma-70 family RNA polymerase sigma factor [Cyclobacteriaceae bacterium]|nr:sigma-70 family RNA polymerase sigma factor [Cyclobacteriaceae bacterium]
MEALEHNMSENGLYLKPQVKTRVSEPVKTDEAQLWKSFKEGDESAFVLIYEKYFDILANYCRQFSSDTELIKDCIQDLFILIRERRGGLGDTDSIRLYLFKACRRKMLELLRQQEQNIFFRNEALRFQALEESAEEQIIKMQSTRENRSKISSALKKLSHREREAIYYFYYHGFQYAQIGELLGYKEIKSVRSLLYKALKKMRGTFSIALFVLAGLTCS